LIEAVLFGWVLQMMRLKRRQQRAVESTRWKILNQCRNLVQHCGLCGKEAQQTGVSLPETHPADEPTSARGSGGKISSSNHSVPCRIYY
jgi:hypothetical protein